MPVHHDAGRGHRPATGRWASPAVLAMAALLTLGPVLAACGVGPSPSASVGPSGAAAGSGAPAGSDASAGPSSPAGGIPGQLEVGQPVPFAKEHLIGMLVRNIGDKVISIATKGTFTGPAGNQTASAHGAVVDLRPGEQRVEILTVEGDPGKDARLSLQPASVVTEEQVPAAAQAATLISFGPATVKPGTVPQLVVPVTNGDQVPHSLVLSSPIMRKGQLVGIASGELDDLGAGQTGQASLAVIGSVDPKDAFAPSVDLVRS